MALGLVALCLAGCATGRSVTIEPSSVSAGLADRVGVDTRGWITSPSQGLPPGVAIQDGLSIEEAVGLALWHNPAFLVTLADLGVARADLVEARLLRNPILSLLFPLGPKQLEATLTWPVDALIHRPRRVAAASLDLESVAARLVADGLGLVASVKRSYIEMAAAERRATLMHDASDVAAKVRAIGEARFKSGDISDLDARATRSEALIAEAAARSAAHDRDLAAIRLRALIGLAPETDVRVRPVMDLALSAFGDIDALMKEAMAARPDVRAAELALEAAGARAGLARAQIWTMTAILDANGAGREGFEIGPGLSGELPILSQNQGNRARAAAQLEKATRQYAAVPPRWPSNWPWPRRGSARPVTSSASGKARSSTRSRPSAARPSGPTKPASCRSSTSSTPSAAKWRFVSAASTPARIGSTRRSRSTRPWDAAAWCSRRVAQSSLVSPLRRMRNDVRQAVRRLARGVTTLALSGCGGDATPPKAAPPAAVANPVTEASLSTITLTPEAEARLGIKVVAARIESIAKTRTVGGEIIVPPGRSVTVSAPIPGTVQVAGGETPHAGSRVARGQTLFTLFPLQPAERDVQVDLDREAAAAAALLQAADQRLARLESLLKDGAASVRAVEEARAQQQVAAAAVTAARARAETVKRGAIGARGEVAVRAPLSGVLQDVAAASGQTVAAGAPLFTVAEVATLWIKVPLYVGDRDRVDASQPVAISGLGGAGPVIVARRVTGPPSANPAASTTDLFFAPVSGGEALRVGDRVSVRVPLRETQEGLVVPVAALVYDSQGGTWVYEAVGNHVFARRRVDVDAHVGDRVVVARGLRAGQSVVTDGVAELFGTEFGAGK